MARTHNRPRGYRVFAGGDGVGGAAGDDAAQVLKD